MTLLDFNELPVGAQASIQTTDQGVISGLAIDPAAAIVTPANVGAVLLAANGNVRYVTEQGSDATGTGSEAQPFLTIQAAITNCAALASPSHPFVISAGPGTFVNSFVLAASVFLVGSGRRTTIIKNPAANWIGTSFAGAVAADTGIMQCGFATNPPVVNYADAAILSTGASRFFLYDVAFDAVASTITGNSTVNLLIGQDWETIAVGGTHAWTNINSICDGVYLRATSLTYTNNAAYALSLIRWGTVQTSGTLTLSCASSTNSLSVLCASAIFPGQIVLTGDGAFLRAAAFYAQTGADANTTFRFDTAVAGAIPMVTGGQNVIVATPTVERVYTMVGPAATLLPSSAIIRNDSATNALVIAFSGASETTQTYVAPLSSAQLVWFNGAVEVVAPQTQRGSVALTNGVSAFIPADIRATTTITCALKTFSGAAGVPAALSADRVNGTRATTGGFKITSYLLSAGTAVVTDQGTYDWQAVG